VSLTARIDRLSPPGDVASLLYTLAEEDAQACSRLLDERAASESFLLAYWAPRVLAGVLGPAEAGLFAVPALTGRPLSRPGALRLAARLGVETSVVERLERLELWRHVPATGYTVHPLALAFARDRTELSAPGELLSALLASDAQDELDEEALGALAPLVLSVADTVTLAEVAPRVIDSLQLADETEAALRFSHAACDRLPPKERARVLFAVGQALELDERLDEALTHYGMAAAFAEPATWLFGRCRSASGDLHVERAEADLAGQALAESHSAFLFCEAWADAADSASTLGALAIVGGHASKAVQWLREALRLGGLAGDLERVASSYDLIAEAERTRGYLEAADAAAGEAARTRTLILQISPEEGEGFA